MVNNWNTPQEWLWPMVGCNTMVENQDSYYHLWPLLHLQKNRGHQSGSQLDKGWGCWPLNWTYKKLIRREPTMSPYPCSVTPGPQRIDFLTASVSLLKPLPDLMEIIKRCPFFLLVGNLSLYFVSVQIRHFTDIWWKVVINMQSYSVYDIKMVQPLIWWGCILHNLHECAHSSSSPLFARIQGPLIHLLVILGPDVIYAAIISKSSPLCINAHLPFISFHQFNVPHLLHVAHVAACT